MRRLPISSALLAALATIALPAGEASALQRLEPELGRKFVVALVSGDVFVKKPGAGRASRLTGRRTIRVGSTVDATKGSVKLVGAFTRKKRSRGVFSEGAFIARQAKRKRAVINLELTGGDTAGCEANTTARAAQSRLVRRLRGRARGRFRTRGSHSAATVRGTKWLTEDFCDTTVITTQEGTVDVSLASAELQLGPGQEFVAYCDPPLDTGLELDYCIAGLNSPNEGIFAVGLGTRVHTGQYTLCIYAPSGDFECRDEPLPEPAPGDDFSISVLGCAPAPDDGAGTYLVEWYYQGFLIGFLYIPVPNPMPQTYDLCPVSFEDLGSVSRQSLTSSEPAGRSLARPPGASAPSARQQLG